MIEAISSWRFHAPALTDNGRIELRLDKATLTRAASLKRLDLTGYILGAVLPKAKADIAEGRTACAIGARLVARPRASGKSAGGAGPARARREGRLHAATTAALVWDEAPTAKRHDRAAFGTRRDRSE